MSHSRRSSKSGVAASDGDGGVMIPLEPTPTKKTIAGQLAEEHVKAAEERVGSIHRESALAAAAAAGGDNFAPAANASGPAAAAAATPAPPVSLLAQQKTISRGGGGGGGGARDDVFKRIEKLQHAMTSGAITPAQYNEQRQLLVDQLTGTVQRANAHNPIGAGGVAAVVGAGPTPIPVLAPVPAQAKGKIGRKEKGEHRHAGAAGGGDAKKAAKKGGLGSKSVIPKPPPDWKASTVPSEQAIVHMFNVDLRTWSNTTVSVKIEPAPFARGSLRLAHHMTGLESIDSKSTQQKYGSLKTGGKSAAAIAAEEKEKAAAAVVASAAAAARVFSTSPDSTASTLEAGNGFGADIVPASGAAAQPAPAAPPPAQHPAAAGGDAKSNNPPPATGAAAPSAALQPLSGVVPSNAAAGSGGGGSGSGTAMLPLTYVAKISIDPFEERDSYFQDVIIQMYAKAYADRYNRYAPPKKVDFVKAYLLELIDRPKRPVCAVERFISGPYRKHNNNFGFVSEDERNTPQAFSHFTYEASNHRILVCDIQGVGDMYTDPQIHSIDGVGFGKGNMGVRGFDKFLSTHRCNAVCRYLKLPLINVRADDVGTVPQSRYMSYHKVEIYHVDMTGVQFSDPAFHPVLLGSNNSQGSNGPTQPLLQPRKPGDKRKNKNKSKHPPTNDAGCCCVVL